MSAQPRFGGGAAERGLVGDSPQIQRVLRTIHKLRNDTLPVLITGESGVGKELVAAAVHRHSSLAGEVFLPVDSASLSGSLMESELFGHVKGAFTGAVRDKIGLAQAANGGTLFLDEVGELTPEVQAKLLRLLQQQEIRPVGGTRPVRVRVRILAATNRNLEAMVSEGIFREDLFYRLNVINIAVPPLRERKSDIPQLAAHFLKAHAVHEVTVSDEVIVRFMAHSWPGNVRELENTIRRMVALKSEPVLKLRDLPTNLRGLGLPGEEEAQPHAGVVVPLAEVERRHILRALDHTKGDVQTAALLLGIGKTTMYRKLRAYRRQDEVQRDPQRRLFA